MRQWTSQASAQTSTAGQALAGMIEQLGQPRFESALLASLNPVLPAASCSVYRTGGASAPRLYMSASHGVPDTTRDCWQAYLSGPYLSDRTLQAQDSRQDGTLLCHITAAEVPSQHRARVYEAHGVAERVSVVRQAGESLFAVNLYRHQHQAPFSDRQLASFEDLAPALLALAQKQVELACPTSPEEEAPVAWQHRLRQINPALTARELDVCARLLTGMTHEGIACDLGLGLPTVKTYRNRAFARLGIHFRNELFALVLRAPGSAQASDQRLHS